MTARDMSRAEHHALREFQPERLRFARGVLPPYLPSWVRPLAWVVGIVACLAALGAWK